MSYITQTDLTKKIGAEKLIQLTADVRGATEPDAAVVAEAIEYAVGVFDSYARTRYSLPVPVTPLVKSVCVNLAAFHLFGRRATSEEGVFKVHKIAHDQAILFLKDIASGKSALDAPATTETIELPASSDRILTNASKARFTDNKLINF